MRSVTRHLLTGPATIAAIAAAVPVFAQAVPPPITDPATYTGFAPRPPAPDAPRPLATPQPELPPVTAPFDIHTIGSNIRGLYVVVPIDMNRDGKQDLIALGQREDHLVWYENPYWTPHIIRTPEALPQMVNMHAADLDGDGIPEIAVTYLFHMNPSLSVGKIAILSSTGSDPDAPWTLREIDRVPSPHRVLFADIDGSGKKALVVAPILNPKSQPVTSNDPDHLNVPLFVYRAPDWKRELVTQANVGPVHGLTVIDWDGDGREDILTSGQSGTWMHGLGKDGKWTRTLLTLGNPAPWPDNGSSDVAVGMLGGRRFFATIEPFHGNLVVVYTQDAQGRFLRNVIDNRLQRGHTIALADFDNDGVPEIVAGASGGASSTYYYKAKDASGQGWTAMLMDNAMAAADCKTGHVRGDAKRTDIFCTHGQGTMDLKWYEYRGD
ncbi:VCBS repeat-containing protein [Sphingomonas sp. AOB5]|uniref:FG-GAP repeat domain-containing protein n=1 Tax=Sphingomonas sp. AOB5 TaxID=3034017 RepID=UPI0023F9C0AD|nr:VCBS repeat-containing protein [Sphingomonas sp. AOB5]MDF7777209.1 VCBS repeat-containing protein [Sphingomonas sp. AOB5]